MIANSVLCIEKEIALALFIDKTFKRILCLISYNEIPNSNIKDVISLVSKVEKLIKKYQQKYRTCFYFKEDSDTYCMLDEATSFIYQKPGDTLEDVLDTIIYNLSGKKPNKILKKSLLAIRIQR